MIPAGLNRLCTLAHSHAGYLRELFLAFVFFLAGDFFFEDDFFDEDFFALGTFAPALRASESPMAMACLRLFTFFPERPLFNVPSFRSCIADATLLCAFLPYLAMRTSIG
jgi:hypothetical protein